LKTFSPPPSKGDAASQTEIIYSVGTLRYNKRQLFVLFFWLMWSGIGFNLVEDISSLNSIMMRDLGATFTQMALLGSLGGFITPFINPWISTWSDRHRSPYGRRRPFIFATVCLYAIATIPVPFMPDLFNYLQHFPAMGRLFSYIPINGAVFLIGVCGFFSGLFNAAFLTASCYLAWDVVPENVLGRFNSIWSNVGMLAAFVWSFWIYGQAEHHMKEVYVGLGIVSLVIYLISVWQVKEGEYPPPDEHKKGGILAPIRAYIVECFSSKYFLWIFAANLFYQLGNRGNWYQFNFLHYDLKLSLGDIGWADGLGRLAASGFGLILGFYLGSITDRLKPVRIIAAVMILRAMVPLWGYFCIHDKQSYLIMVCMGNMMGFVYSVVFGAFTVEIFPRDKLGQFCSAQALFYQFVSNVTDPLVGMLFDHLKNNRFAYIWTDFFYILAGLTYLKVYYNWKEKRGIAPAISEIAQ
jgi:maltose/moltooligosaccharide transporter